MSRSFRFAPCASSSCFYACRCPETGSHFRATCSRVETQSCPPYAYGSQVACCREVYCELVVSGGDAPPILQAAEGSFDDVSALVSLSVEWLDMFSRWIVGDHRLGTALNKEGAQSIAVIGGVGGAQAAGWQGCEQGNGNGRVAPLPRRYLERERTAATVDNSMDFCRSAASRAADRLIIRPPFPPAADRWALAVVLSIMWISRSLVCTRASNKRRHIPRADQRWKRL